MIVASPHRDTVTEAVWFAEQIAEHGITRVAGVANRVHPPFGDGTAAEALAAADAAEGDVAALWRNVAALRALAEAARDELAPFAALLGERSADDGAAAVRRRPRPGRPRGDPRPSLRRTVTARDGRGPVRYRPGP